MISQFVIFDLIIKIIFILIRQLQIFLKFHLLVNFTLTENQKTKYLYMHTLQKIGKHFEHFLR